MDLHLCARRARPRYFRPQYGEPDLLTPPGIAIGLTSTDIFEANICDEVVSLSEDDLLVFYTDGVTEAVNLQKEQFGNDRLVEMVRLAAPIRASMILQHLSQQLQMFVQDAARFDDMTMIVVRRATH